MSVIRVRIPARWEMALRHDRSITLNAVADFSLGEGPCGKTVERLEVEFTQYGVLIVQICTCHERKEFVYPWHTVTGRVEVTHG